MKHFSPYHSGGITVEPQKPKLRYANLTAYSPYGLPLSDWQGEERYLYSGKELDRTGGLMLYDFHARQYDPQLGRFTSQDPLQGKYPSLNSYLYCAANPISLTDPTGMTLKCMDTRSRELLFGTINQEFSKNVTINEEGYVNVTPDENSNNDLIISIINTLVQSDREYTVEVGESYHNKNESFEFKDDDKKGCVGVTLIPNAKADPSYDENVHVVISSYLNDFGQIENISHELYGHAYIYELNQLGQSDIYPFHTEGTVKSYLEYDNELQMEVINTVRGRNNFPLENWIDRVVKEGLNNYYDKLFNIKPTIQ